MSINALSGHGTKIDYQLTPGGAWVEIDELKDVNAPGLTRNEFDATIQNDNIDAYVSGVLRRRAVTVDINYIPANVSHQGLRTLLINKTRTGFRQRYPDASYIIASGEVLGFEDTEPVDGLMTAAVTLRFSGRMNDNGVIVG